MLASCVQNWISSRGAALENAISYWINVALLAIYNKFSLDCTKSWIGFSKEALHDTLNFLKLAIPSAVMICSDCWPVEMVTLLSGLLPNPKLETSVLSISLNTCWMVYMISVGLGAARSTRVSNELGAGNPKFARLALCFVVIMALSEHRATQGEGRKNRKMGLLPVLPVFQFLYSA